MFLRRVFSSSAHRWSQRSQEEINAYKRKRQAEWKRTQGGNAFLDHLIVTVRGGKGGDGCAAFHREKFKPFGPPSGGNGGHGGSVHFLPTPTLSTLSTIPNRIRGHNGENGKGTWQNGKAAEPLVIKVPVGTVVRELGRNDPRRAKDEWENEEESMVADGLTTRERIERMREKRWLHYPGHGETNAQRDDFKEVEAAMYKLERERRLARRRRLDENPIFLDLDKQEGPGQSSSSSSPHDADNAPLGIRQPEYLGHIIAQGGQGGYGNPHYVSTTNRTPRYASRGHEGERVTLFLELKLLADIGLVGMPNAGKSTLLRALTGGRAKTDVAGYAFTTLNPVVGLVRVAEDGTFEGELVPDETTYGETKIEKKAFTDKLYRGEFAHSPTRNQKLDSSSAELPSSSSSSSSTIDTEMATDSSKPTRPGHYFDLYESLRFTIADNPGLIENSSSPLAHAGLGHSFLRAIERSPTLVCVVDFSSGQSHQSLTTTNSETSVPSDDAPTNNYSNKSPDLANPVEASQVEADNDDVIATSAEPQPIAIDPITIDVDPCEAIKILKNELEAYQEGMSSRIKMVLANKADVIAPQPLSSSSSSSSSSATLGDSAKSIEGAKSRLKQLEKVVKAELGEDVIVVPVSAKYRMNLRKVVALMQNFVQDAKETKLASIRRGEAMAREETQSW